MSRLPGEIKKKMWIIFRISALADLDFENMNQDISETIIARSLKLCQPIEDDK